MAHLHPSAPAHWREHQTASARERAELEVLQKLERGLSAAYTLFHSVDWSRPAGAREQHGEVDIVAVNQAGDVLLMEVKAGDLEFLPDGIVKSDCGQSPAQHGPSAVQLALT